MFVVTGSSLYASFTGCVNFYFENDKNVNDRYFDGILQLYDLSKCFTGAKFYILSTLKKVKLTRINFFDGGKLMFKCSGNCFEGCVT